MKNNIKIFFATILMGVSTAQAANYQDLVCASASGFQPKDGIIYGSKNPSLDSAETLRGLLAQVPNDGEAAYSELLSGYVSVKTKKLSKLVVSTQSIPDAFSESCIGMTAPLSFGDCFRGTACVTVAATFSYCTNIKYDPNTGNKIVTCPDGQIIKP